MKIPLTQEEQVAFKLACLSLGKSQEEAAKSAILYLVQECFNNNGPYKAQSGLVWYCESGKKPHLADGEENRQPRSDSNAARLARSKNRQWFKHWLETELKLLKDGALIY